MSYGAMFTHALLHEKEAGVGGEREEEGDDSYSLLLFNPSLLSSVGCLTVLPVFSPSYFVSKTVQQGKVFAANTSNLNSLPKDPHGGRREPAS